MDLYKFNLNTFKYPPTENSTLSELEKIAQERLQLYKIMDDARQLNLKTNSKKWDSYVESKIGEKRLRTYLFLLRDEEYAVGLVNARRNNHIAHWLLSLCYCRESTLRHFFMHCELYWFIMLYKRLKKDDLIEFLRQNGFTHQLVTKKEIEAIKCNASVDPLTFNEQYYKVRFAEVTSLVKARKTLLIEGFAYVPERDILHYVSEKLWNQFGKQLSWTRIIILTRLKGDRISELLKNIPLITPSEGSPTNLSIKIKLDDIDEIAERHYPLCMKMIHGVLRENHHLKYDCKMQYGLFLKSLGLAYEDAMEFWKREFTRKMSNDTYNRKYQYLFKHQYGKVGGRIDYRGYDCERICDMEPGPGQHHGCPFKHWDRETLVEKCRADKVNATYLQEIFSLVDRRKFKEACTAYFCATHKVLRESIVQSPNEYVKESFEIEIAVDSYLGAIFESCDTVELF